MWRAISLAFGVAAYVTPIVWTRYSIWAAEEQGGYVCGLMSWALFFQGLMGGGLFSALAVLTGAFVFFRLAKPRPMQRIAELSVLGAPFALAFTLLGLLFLSEFG